MTTEELQVMLDDVAFERGYKDGSHRHPINANPYLTAHPRSLYVEGWVDGWKAQQRS